MTRYFIFLPIFLTALSSLVFAQQKQQSLKQDSSFVVEPNIILNDVIPISEQYYYGDFIKGKVVYRDGRSGETSMNYNRLTDEMLFISTWGDTLALAEEPTIRYIAINRDTFFWQDGYLMLVKSFADVRLGMKQGFVVADRKKDTGHDMISSASSGLSFTSLYDERRMYSLKVKEQIVVRKFRQYYFGDKYNHFVVATDKTLSELFPQCIDHIRKFCKKYRIRFHKKDEVEKVISFMAYACL